jgi:hypothetical protein
MRPVLFPAPLFVIATGVFVGAGAAFFSCGRFPKGSPYLCNQEIKLTQEINFRYTPKTRKI